MDRARGAILPLEPNFKLLNGEDTAELFLTRSYSTKPCVAFEAVLRRR